MTCLSEEKEYARMSGFVKDIKENLIDTWFQENGQHISNEQNNREFQFDNIKGIVSNFWCPLAGCVILFLDLYFKKCLGSGEIFLEKKNYIYIRLYIIFKVFLYTYIYFSTDRRIEA